MEVWIVRHAEPDYEHDSITEKGEREAKLLADRLSQYEFSAVYVSPMGRARKTASYYLEKTGRTAEVLNWLHEFKGTVVIDGNETQCWDRLPNYWTKIDDYYSYENWLKVPLMKAGNVESEYEKVKNGVDSLFEKYGYKHCGRLYKVQKPNHDRILLFCHFGVEAAMLSHIIHASPMLLWHNFVALPTSVTRLASVEREEGIAVFNVIQFGDLSHLFAGGEDEAFAARFCECFTDETRH